MKVSIFEKHAHLFTPKEIRADFSTILEPWLWKPMPPLPGYFFIRESSNIYQSLTIILLYLMNYGASKFI